MNEHQCMGWPNAVALLGFFALMGFILWMFARRFWFNGD